MISTVSPPEDTYSKALKPSGRNEPNPNPRTKRADEREPEPERVPHPPSPSPSALSLSLCNDVCRAQPKRARDPGAERTKQGE